MPSLYRQQSQENEAAATSCSPGSNRPVLEVRFRSVVVITFALHAKGRGFEPRRNLGFASSDQRKCSPRNLRALSQSSRPVRRRRLAEVVHKRGLHGEGTLANACSRCAVCEFLNPSRSHTLCAHVLRYGHASLCFSTCRKPFSKHADISGRFAIKSTTGGTRTRNPRLTRHLTQVEVHRLGGRCLIHWATVALVTVVPPFLAHDARALASRLQEYTLAPCERLVCSKRPKML